MHEHMASHKGPFFCRVEGCKMGPFVLPKCLNHHMEERHGFSARKEWWCKQHGCLCIVLTFYDVVAWVVTFISCFTMINDLSECSFTKWPCKQLVTCHSLQCPQLVACMVTCNICPLVWYIKSGIPGKVAPGKVKQLQAIDHTSDWSLPTYFISGKVGPLCS